MGRLVLATGRRRRVHDLWTVWASGSNDVWLGGDTSQGGGVVVRGAGTTAAPFDLSSYAGQEVRCIWGSGAGDVWVSPYEGPLQHWDGAAWSAAASLPASAQVFGVAGTASNDTWAVGAGGAVFHYDGGTWSALSIGTTAPLAGIWTDSTLDAWAVGAGGVAIRWNGTVWGQ